VIISEQNKALAKRWFEEVWNQGRELTIDQLFHPQGKIYGFPEADSVLIGPAGFKTIHRVFRSAFGSLQIYLDDLVAEADRVAIRWTRASPKAPPPSQPLGIVLRAFKGGHCFGQDLKGG
jgi:hypothetical protein